MKKHEWDNPNKMHFESEHKTFNRQTNCISVGNVIANTQYSSYIRPYAETECSHTQFALGHLQNYDLGGFRSFNIGYLIDRYIRPLTHTNGGILYVFFHYSPEKRTRRGDRTGGRIVDGIVLTTCQNKHVETWYMPNHSWKSYSAVEAAKAYIIEE